MGKRKISGLGLLSSALLGTALLAHGDGARSAFELPAVPVPAGNEPTPERVELGKMPFFDPRLSGSNWISCASCHNPALGWSDGLPTAKGDGMHSLPRATPSIVNSGFNELQTWDGRFRSLEEQVWGPVSSTAEMRGSPDEVLAKLRAIRGYQEAFGRAYPNLGITKDTVAKAIASFERTVVSTDSPFDRWQHGDEAAVSVSAKRGFALFRGKANCIACHSGPNLADQGFHNVGLADNRDEGRYLKVPVGVLHGAFKTPTLRDIALTAPYMHNGMYRTLAEVVDHYDRGGDDKSHLDPNLKPLDLSAQEKEDLVEFLKTLTGKAESITVPRLPQ